MFGLKVSKTGSACYQLQDKKGKKVKTTASFKEGSVKQHKAKDGSDVIQGVDPNTGKTKTITSQVLNDGKTLITTDLGDGKKIINTYQNGQKGDCLIIDKAGKVYDAENKKEKTVSNEQQGFIKGALTMLGNAMTDIASNQPQKNEPKASDGWFKLSMDQVSNLIKTSDGVVPFDIRDWTDFPERKGNTNDIWNPGLTEQLEDPSGNSYRKGTQDGGIDANEAWLMSNQSHWAAEQAHSERYIQQETALETRNFLNYISRGSSYMDLKNNPKGESIISGVDSNNNGRFDLDDAKSLEFNDTEAGLSLYDLVIANERSQIEE